MDTGLDETTIALLSLSPFFIFLLGIFIFWIFAFFLLYHFMRFGVGSAPKKTAFVFLTGALIIFIFVVFFYAQIDIDKLLIEIFGEVQL